MQNMHLERLTISGERKMGLMDSLLGRGQSVTKEQEEYDRYIQKLASEDHQLANVMQGQYAASHQALSNQAVYAGALQGHIFSAAGQQAMTLNSNGNLGIGASPYGSSNAQKTFNPNEDPAYQMPLSALADLWAAKFGDVWVEVSALREDDFWGSAARRLSSNAELEIAHYGEWMRIKER